MRPTTAVAQIIPALLLAACATGAVPIQSDLADASKHDFVLFENPNHYNNGKCLHCGQAEEFHGVKG